MRIISGIYGGRLLKSPSGAKTRPTSDRLRETLFNILGPFTNDETRFLDLCAGTGAVGIEALSRGADFVTFVDMARKSCALIEENLDQLAIPEDRTEVFCSDAVRFLKKRTGTGWDVVFFDPPYSENYLDVLELFGDADMNLLREGGMVIAEHHSKSAVPDEAGELRRWRLLRQGETRLSFYERG